MIRFRRPADTTFDTLLSEAIQRIADSYLSFEDPRDQQDWLCAALPRSARFFTCADAKAQLRALETAQGDDHAYDLTKYHWLLLYECLETFCHEFNEQPTGALRDQHGIRRINFTALIGLFFWSTDFLDHNGAKMVRNQTQPMLIIPETLGLGAGFTYHPHELSLVPCGSSEEMMSDHHETTLGVSDSGEYPVQGVGLCGE